MSQTLPIQWNKLHAWSHQLRESFEEIAISSTQTLPCFHSKNTRAALQPFLFVSFTQEVNHKPLRGNKRSKRQQISRQLLRAELFHVMALQNTEASAGLDFCPPPIIIIIIIIISLSLSWMEP